MRNLISGGSGVRILNRSILNLPGTINLNPSLYALQRLEHYRTVNQQIADYREGSSWLQTDWLLELINQSTASLTCTAIDNHHASTAYLLQAVALPSNWSNTLTRGSYRVLLDFHQRCNYIQGWAIRNFKLLSIRLASRAILTLYNKLYGFLLFCHSTFSPYYCFFATA